MQVAATALGGRDFEGQVTKEINGKTYILIGNEQQLRAIGSGKKVIGRINKVTQTCTGQGLFGYDWVDGASSTEYAGDADLSNSDTLRDAVVRKWTLIRPASGITAWVLMVRKRTTLPPTLV